MKKFFTTLILSVSLAIGAYAQYENTKIQIGQQAPDLVFNDPNGKALKLSEINKGRIVLVDFWASWCGPCRKANPNLVAFYNTYKDKKFKGAKKGFTIVSVSLDQNKEAWIKAIETDKLNWEYHMSDLGGWRSKPADIYGVQFVPQAFLLSSDGKIIGKYMTSEEAEADVQKLLQ